MSLITILKHLMNLSVRGTTVDTSTGPVALSEPEHALLERLLAGTASMDEGQAFYQAIAGRNLAFPMEWEVHVLRTTVAALPDRDDLLARLAFVEEALSSSNASFDASSRLAFERAWARFARIDLNAGTDKTGRAQTLRMAIDDACTLLSSAAFERQTISRKIQLIVALHNTLMGDPSPELLLVADLGLRRFRELLQDPELSEPDACAVYDALHSLYFSGVSDVRDLRRFDAIVAPFEAWLEARHGHQLAQRMPVGNSRPLTIAYFLHTAHLDRGNAVSPLIGSLAIMHAARSDRRILVYAVQYVAPDFLAWMTDHGIPVRILRSAIEVRPD